MDIVTAVEVFLGMRCEGCNHYMNEKGEHIDAPPPLDEPPSS